MRPGQQQQQNNNKRMRGRGRKGPNTMSRSYESNGPDVKIRGTAQHIAEKYATLARDATSAGDRVMAENYFQHSEHYGRIVAAAQGSFQPAQIERDYDSEEDEGEDGADFAPPQQQPAQQQPRQDGRNGQYRDRNDGNREQRGDNNQYRDRDGNRDQRNDGNRDQRNDGNREFREPRGDGNREFRNDGNRDQRGGFNNRDRRDGNPQGNGQQPYAREGSDDFAQQARQGEDRGPRQDRSHERGGERRFEERGPRQDRGEPPRNERSDEDAGRRTEAAEPNGGFAPRVDTASEHDAPRRRGRPRRQPMTEEAVGEVPSGFAASPASVSADAPVQPAPDAELTPRRRGRPPRVPMEAAEAAPTPVETQATEAPVKRRPGRPRKVRPEDEPGGDDDGGGENRLPAFLLASNG